MALLSVINAGAEAPQESGFDKVVKALSVAGQLIGVGAEVSNAYTRHQQAQTDAKLQTAKENEVNADIGKNYSIVTTPDDPQAVPFQINGQTQYRKFDAASATRPKLLEYAAQGYGKFISGNEAKDAQASGSLVLPYSGDLYFQLDNDKVKLNNNKIAAETQKNLAEANKFNAEAQNVGTQKKLEREKQLDTRASELAKIITDSSSRSTIGRLTGTIDRSQAVQALIGEDSPEAAKETDQQKIERFNKLTDFQKRELAAGLNSVIQQGIQGSETGIQELTPDSLEGKMQSIYQKLTNTPQGQNQGELIAILAKTLKREHETATRQLDLTLDQLGQGFRDLKNERPDQFRAIIFGGRRAQEAPTASSASVPGSAAAPTSTPAGGKPPTVMQNGHVYRLNPQTGEYE